MKMEKYVTNFVENGVEDLETILELQGEHLDMMSVPLGHKLKIIKKINEMWPSEEEAKVPRPDIQEAPTRPMMADSSTQDEGTAALSQEA